MVPSVVAELVLDYIVSALWLALLGRGFHNYTYIAATMNTLTTTKARVEVGHSLRFQGACAHRHGFRLWLFERAGEALAAS